VSSFGRNDGFWGWEKKAETTTTATTEANPYGMTNKKKQIPHSTSLRAGSSGMTTRKARTTARTTTIAVFLKL
jgi:hypothetical protein